MMPPLDTLTLSWRQAHGTVFTPNTLAAFENSSKINYALAVIALFWVKYSFEEHRHPFERKMTWPGQLICLEIIIILVISRLISIYAPFSPIHFQNNYNNEFRRINYGNAAIILLASKNTQNTSFTTFSVGFMVDLLLTWNSTPTRFKYLRTENSEEYSKPKV